MMSFSVSLSAKEKTISSYSELKSAIQAAKSGDVLLVGDIDFTPPGDVFNSWMRIEINKSLTIKSANDKSVFKNGAFILSGDKSGASIIVNFEGIVFDGGVDTANLSDRDFDWPYDENEERYTHDEPLMAQQAITYKGNVDSSFNKCEFKNYMHEYGPIMNIHYGDYTSIPILMEMFGDYSACHLNIAFDDCLFSDNVARYDGGALYIEGNNNIELSINNSTFKGNKSGAGQFSMGGGAIYLSGCKTLIEDSLFENNLSNHIFMDAYLSDMDTTKGGAIYAYNGELVLRNTLISSNTSSMGGGLAFTNSNGEIDGCVIKDNRAEAHTDGTYEDKGPWSNMAQGGALYHEGINGSKISIINSSIYGNSAENAYGGIYSYYNEAMEEMDVTYLEMNLSTYIGNTCDSEYNYVNPDFYMLWASHPADVFAIPHFSYSGNIIIDETFEKDFARSDTSNYNYLASPSKAKEDGLEIDVDNNHLVIKSKGNIDTTIPAEIGMKMINGRYNIKKFVLGSNYDESLYSGKSKVSISVYAVIIGALVMIGFLCYKNKEGFKANNQKIVKAWFNEEEIERLKNIDPKIQTLTNREFEVLMEMLSGKKQKEIAYELGIGITTVKDYYRKIYDKLDCANKEDLLKKYSELIYKK
ncbi:MAG: LuxR C-terminal-related transcriptional regulator [Erysipelotrichaceae bacterium]|nr:LuxR C-terminal-related transcriptional regulator [Erysipelotrichaceae bacterium]